MDRVLITGATASQYSDSAHKRSARFSGLLHSALNYSGVTASMSAMPVNSDSSAYKDYESVVVGLAPVSSMSANKIYAALTAVGHARENSNLKILFDAPEPHLVYQSLRSIVSNPEILTKPLYSSRFGFSEVSSNKDFRNFIMETIEFLLSGDYDVVVPRLPYFSGSREIYGIPEVNGRDLIELNFDRLFSDRLNISKSQGSNYWVIENPSTKWAKDIAKTVSNSVIGVRKTQYDTESDYINRMHNSYGYLLNTYKNGTPWWSPHIMVAMSCGIPVFSDWRHTGALGTYWSALPHTVESMTNEERLFVSEMQKISYLDFCPDWDISSKYAARKILN